MERSLKLKAILIHCICANPIKINLNQSYLMINILHKTSHHDLRHVFIDEIANQTLIHWSISSDV
jgi:hypothetical protein